MKKNNAGIMFWLILILVASSCNMPWLAVKPTEEAPSATATSAPDLPASSIPESTATVMATAAAPAPTVDSPTPTLAVAHSLVPLTSIKAGKLIKDVVSVDTAKENRAPYGDSYKINRFERPFMQDMSYVPDLDIISFNLGQDEKFYYVSIELVGTDPNNPLGINYAVELDTEADGFGDYIIVAQPPYSVDWSTDHVQVFQDTNHDTGGLSAENTDAPVPGDGYDALIFDGGRGRADDPDLAWVRINAGKYATVQFAFKLALAEARFMCGVLADAGLKDVARLDYVDRFTEAEAGSPVKGNPYYPLKALYGVDNVCREAYGFGGNHEEPQRCP